MRDLARFSTLPIADILSGFSVFLVALPLSIGISIASGAPPTAGLIAAIVGGIGGYLTKSSKLTIGGPAAGLIVIVLAAVHELGQGDSVLGYRRMLAATLVAGVMQIAMGKARLGKFGLCVPSAAIHGLLAAIGLIIFGKQITVALGVPAASSIINAFLTIPQSMQHMNTEVAFIAISSMALILGHSHIKTKWIRYLPAPLFVVALGIYLAKIFDFDHEHLVVSHMESLSVGPKLLLPVQNDFLKFIVLPDFSMMFSFVSLKHSVTIALIASIETLLTVNAIDRLDLGGDTSDPNREMISKGICNMICGLIGGLPIIAEIARSSANVRNGAVSGKANLFHGVFILAFLILAPEVLHLIPLSALAAVLIAVGFHLAHPRQFIHAKHIGWEYLLSFCITIAVTLVSDLLLGVLAGTAVKIAVNFYRGARLSDFFGLKHIVETSNNLVCIKVLSPILFSNAVTIEQVVYLAQTAGNRVVIDCTESKLIDHSAMEKMERAVARYPNVSLVLSDTHQSVTLHPLAARRLSA